MDIELLEAIKQKDKNKIKSIQGNYNHPDIKKAVILETRGKCIYCESKVRHTSPGDMEHIAPKSMFPQYCFRWSNLTFACSECNRRKRDYFSLQNPLLNPYLDDPSEHLMAFGPFIHHLPGKVRGKLTVAKLELNRADLWERRKEQIEKVGVLADAWALTSDGDVRDLLLKEIRTEVESDKEYSFVVVSFLRSSKVPI